MNMVILTVDELSDRQSGGYFNVRSAVQFLCLFLYASKQPNGLSRNFYPCVPRFFSNGLQFNFSLEGLVIRSTRTNLVKIALT